jgi:hypothetical protein
MMGLLGRVDGEGGKYGNKKKSLKLEQKRGTLE